MQYFSRKPKSFKTDIHPSKDSAEGVFLPMYPLTWGKNLELFRTGKGSRDSIYRFSRRHPGFLYGCLLKIRFQGKDLQAAQSANLWVLGRWPLALYVVLWRWKRCRESVRSFEESQAQFSPKHASGRPKKDRAARERLPTDSAAETWFLGLNQTTVRDTWDHLVVFFERQSPRIQPAAEPWEERESDDQEG